MDNIYYSRLITSAINNYTIEPETSPALFNILLDIERETSKERADREALKKRYRGITPILSRTLAIDGVTVKGKINNQLSSDFFSELINDKVGFMGSPKYTVSGSYYADTTGDIQNLEKCIKVVNEFTEYEELADADAELLKESATTGIAYRLLYHTNGQPHVMSVPSSQAYHIDDKQTRYGFRFYSVGPSEYIELYTKEYYFRFAKRYDSEDSATVTGGNLEECTKHLFVDCPLIPFRNNSEHLGDCTKVLSYIDQYDRTLSDLHSEINQFRLAYLAVEGASLPAPGSSEYDTWFQRLLQTGVFEVPNGAKVGYLTKVIDIQGILNALADLEDKIYRFSAGLNYSIEKLGNISSAVGLRQRLQQVKNKCVTASRKFETASREMFRLLAGYWQLKGVCSLNWLSLKTKFTFSYVSDIESEARFLSTFGYAPSRKTAFSTVSFIENAEVEEQELEEEKANYISLETLTDNTEDQTEDLTV